MSADNFVGVRPQKVNGQLTGNYEIFEYGCMSILGEDCMYLADAEPTQTINRAASDLSGNMTRAYTLMVAHDMVKNMDICEYGVVEMEPIPDKPCGRCFVCVHERSIVADDLPRCKGCGEVISDGEWMILTSGSYYHSRCRPKLELV